MSFLYLTRTVHMPVKAVGLSILNSFGIEIATTTDSFTATAMAELINMASPLAKAMEDEHEAKDASFARTVFSARRTTK